MPGSLLFWHEYGSGTLIGCAFKAAVGAVIVDVPAIHIFDVNFIETGVFEDEKFPVLRVPLGLAIFIPVPERTIDVDSLPASPLVRLEYPVSRELVVLGSLRHPRWWVLAYVGRREAKAMVEVLCARLETHGARIRVVLSSNQVPREIGHCVLLSSLAVDEVRASLPRHNDFRGVG
jgi:hypothetical protein